MVRKITSNSQIPNDQVPNDQNKKKSKGIVSRLCNPSTLCKIVTCTAVVFAAIGFLFSPFNMSPQKPMSSNVQKLTSFQSVSTYSPELTTLKFKPDGYIDRMGGNLQTSTDTLAQTLNTQYQQTKIWLEKKYGEKSLSSFSSDEILQLMHQAFQKLTPKSSGNLFVINLSSQNSDGYRESGLNTEKILETPHFDDINEWEKYLKKNAPEHVKAHQAFREQIARHNLESGLDNILKKPEKMTFEEKSFVENYFSKKKIVELSKDAKSVMTISKKGLPRLNDIKGWVNHLTKYDRKSLSTYISVMPKIEQEASDDGIRLICENPINLQVKTFLNRYFRVIPEAKTLPQLMREFSEQLAVHFQDSEQDPFYVAAYIQMQLMRIQPFYSSNSQMAETIANWYLNKRGLEDIIFKDQNGVKNILEKTIEANDPTILAQYLKQQSPPTPGSFD